MVIGGAREMLLGTRQPIYRLEGLEIVCCCYNVNNTKFSLRFLRLGAVALLASVNPSTRKLVVSESNINSKATRNEMI